MLTGVKIPFDVAQQKTNENPLRIFMKVREDGRSGFERSHNDGLAEIGVTAKFPISQSDKIFTIGSCFARNIEAHLSGSNLDVLTLKYTIDDNLYELRGVGARNGALNAYTPASMLELINIHKRQDKETCAVIKTGDDEFVDMLMTGIRPVNSRELNYVRSKLLGAYAELSNADVVIITLGYTESWYDVQDRMFVNKSPAGSRKTIRHGDRFQFLNMSSSGVIEALHAIVAEIRAQSGEKAKVIMTVSPVPIHGTFTDLDVVIANLYSKSTLVSAAISVSADYEYVDYYPSYEMVIYSNANDTWEADGVHVKQSRVKQVVERFVQSYVIANA